MARLLLLLLGAVGTAAAAPLDGARQLVTVTARGWDGVAAEVRRWERTGARGAWRPVGEARPAVVGRSGLAWGSAGERGPRKREGDGRSPAGAFRLGRAFGVPPAPPGLRLPFTALDVGVECVDDARSAYYNRLVDRTRIARPDWKSSERMLDYRDAYRRGVVIEHNLPRPSPGAGSCIFLHVWGDAATGTAGCTALAAEHVEELLGWLDPAKRPVIVQLPVEEYARLRRRWGLP